MQLDTTRKWLRITTWQQSHSQHLHISLTNIFGKIDIQFCIINGKNWTVHSSWLAGDGDEEYVVVITFIELSDLAMPETMITKTQHNQWRLLCCILSKQSSSLAGEDGLWCSLAAATVCWRYPHNANYSSINYSLWSCWPVPVTMSPNSQPS